MGCWNQTDLLTNLPIRAGAPVRALILTPAGSGGDASFLPFGPSTPTNRYEPIGFPLRGIYNDYGWIEEIPEDVAAASVRRYFAETHSLGDLDLADLDEDLDTLCRATCEAKRAGSVPSEVLGRPVPQNPRTYGVTLMHERSYQALLAATANYTDWSRPLGEDVDAQIAAFRAAVQQKPWGLQFEPDYMSPSCDDAMSAHHLLSMNVAGDAIFDTVAEGRDNDVVLAAARDFLLLLNGLRLGRISLQPTSGQGLQDAAYAITKALFEAGLTQIAERQKDDEDEA